MPSVVEASLPYLSLSSDGVFVNLKGKSKSLTRDIGYSNALAMDFSEQLSQLETDIGAISDEETNQDSGMAFYSGPDLNLQQTSVSEAASFKVGYTYNQTLDNIYKAAAENREVRF